MALNTHPTGTEGVYEDNLPRVAGVEVRKAKRYKGRMGSRGEGRAKEKENRFFFLKIYEDQLGSKSKQQPFPGNDARKVVGYFNDVN